MNIAEKITRLRKDKKMSQSDLAERTGLTQTYISQIERGKQSPTLKSLEKISQALGIPFPVLSFLALEDSDIDPKKLEAFKMISADISEMIEKVFFED